MRGEQVDLGVYCLVTSCSSDADCWLLCSCSHRTSLIWVVVCRVHQFVLPSPWSSMFDLY